MRHFFALIVSVWSLSWGGLSLEGLSLGGLFLGGLAVTQGGCTYDGSGLKGAGPRPDQRSVETSVALEGGVRDQRMDGAPSRDGAARQDALFDEAGPGPDQRPSEGLGTDHPAAHDGTMGADGVLADRALPAPDRSLPDAAPADRGVDLPAPDAADPSLLLDERFDDGFGPLVIGRGTWIPDNTTGLLRQSDVEPNGGYILYSPPINDYLAETVVRIDRIAHLLLRYEGAGIGLRVTAGGPLSPPRQVVCWVSPDDNALALSTCDGISGGCVRAASQALAVAFGTPYRLRASAVGNHFSCEAPDLGLALSYDLPIASAGGVALVTLHADATFDYLRVYAR